MWLRSGTLHTFEGGGRAIGAAGCGGKPPEVVQEKSLHSHIAYGRPATDSFASLYSLQTHEQLRDLTSHLLLCARC